MRRAISKHSYHSGVGAYRWHLRRQQLMDLAIISSKVNRRKDLIEVSFDTMTRVACGVAYPNKANQNCLILQQ